MSLILQKINRICKYIFCLNNYSTITELQFVIRYLSYGPYIITLEISNKELITENQMCSKLKRIFTINKDKLRYTCNKAKVVNIKNKYLNSIKNQITLQINGESVELEIGKYFQLKNQKIYYFYTEIGAFYYKFGEYMITYKNNFLNSVYVKL
jgi:hypothetical protein